MGSKEIQIMKVREKGGTRSLMLQPTHMLKDSVIIKEINVFEMRSDVHWKNEEGA